MERTEINSYVALWLSSRGLLSKSSIARLRMNWPIVRGALRGRAGAFLELALDSPRRIVGADLETTAANLTTAGHLRINPDGQYALTSNGSEYYKQLKSELPGRGPLRDLRNF